MIGVKDVISFQGETVAGAVKAFRESVEDYLDFREFLGESPERVEVTRSPDSLKDHFP